MNDWINAKDKKPLNKAPFIGTDNEKVFVAYWNHDSNSYEVGGWENCFMCGGLNKVSFTPNPYAITVTYWMPAPQIPTKN
jgi:hypothetical protein